MPFTEQRPISVEVQNGHHLRRQFYDFIRNNYSLLITKADETLDTFIVSLDLTLHSLLSYQTTPDDLLALYEYIHRGPQHAQANKGICIGKNLSRENRTEVYRFISKKFRSLESKTIETTGQQVRPALCLCLSLSTPLTLSSCHCLCVPSLSLLIEMYEILLETQNSKEY
jgi:hypothetical protein